uniref:JmjC domain-containing protein n=1 Tax=Anopheles farauti TaxID=69004 RepID=A0A182QT04_9DIPT
MHESINMDPTKLKDIILNAKRPYVIQNATHTQWKCFHQTFEEWCKGFDAMTPNLVPFEGCSKKGNSTPQWERQRTKVMMKMQDICKPKESSNNRWNSFSYRNIGQLPEPCRRGINFAAFGFPEIDEDITFWIGSAGAHTPCHYDTYGCNIVVQVYGRKSWILLPPEAKLTPVRVPYEESSVYCEQNFYSPSSYVPFVHIEDNVYHVVLEPGMALIVPPRWWHYVENLEPSLNLNTWLSLQTDLDSLISECITKLVLQDLCNGKPEVIRNHIINPTEDLLATGDSVDETYDILNYLLGQKQKNKHQCPNMSRYPWGYLNNDDFSNLIEGYDSFIKPVQKLDQWDFFKIISRNRLRYDSLNRCSEELPVDDAIQLDRLRNLINISCHPNTIKLMEKQLLED